MLGVGVLGLLEVTVDGRPVELTAGRLRALLAVLALSAGRPVSVDRIAEALWDTDPPATIRASVATYVTRLRAALGTVAISAGPGGYALDADPDQVDALRFTDLLDRAARTPDPAAERVLLDDALRLWRGTPLDGVPSGWLARTVTPRLVERRLSAVERHVDLRPSDEGEAEPLLRDLITQHPLRESLWVRLLLLLRRSGRPAEALEQYAVVRALLADELGTDPGPELQLAYAELLAGQAPPADTAPRQLPATAQMFTGRVDELAALGRPARSSTVEITVIDGMAGIGKTALAVQAAHLLADRYPGGQLFLDLHGYTRGLAPVEPAEALERLLRALGVAGAQIPAGLDERAALYRTRLAGRRMLLLLDNAATEDQVLPLLPGAPGGLVMITSRRRLAGLDHTRTFSLDPLPPADAAGLFVRTAGAGQPADLVAEVVEMCGRLPLAIRIAAGRLRSHPTWNLSHLARRLRDQHHRLAELEAGQRSVTTALDLSYQDLNAGQQRAYRLLGRHPGADIDAYATAALLDTAVIDAGRMLDQLLDVHLLTEPTPGRYRFHDLVRAHAARLTADDDAVGRLLDYYRQTASLAVDAAYPFEREPRPQVPRVVTPGPDLTDPATAQDWLHVELDNLLATARYAADDNRHAHVLHLAAVLRRYLRSGGGYHDGAVLHRLALAGARALGDRVGEADALVGLGHIDRLLDRHTQATDHFEQALRIARATGHHPVELDALSGLGQIEWMQGRYGPATDHFERALRVARATDHRPGELDALIGLGHIRLMQGAYAEATDDFEQMLKIAREIEHDRAELNALIGLGTVDRAQGRYAQAGLRFGQVTQIARAIGHRLGELQGLTGLGAVDRIQGRSAEAAHHYQQVLDLARQTGDRNFEYEARQGLGLLRHATGHHEAAAAHHTEALALADELGQPVDQARAHDGLAHAHHALHRPETARDHWQQALTILIEVGIDATDDEETTVTAIRAHLATG